MIGLIFDICVLIILVGISDKINRIMEHLGLEVSPKKVKKVKKVKKSKMPVEEQVIPEEVPEEQKQEVWTAEQFQEYIKKGGKYR